MTQKITPGLEIAIVRMIKEGMRHQDIATCVGGAVSTIRKIASKHGATRSVGRPRKEGK